MHLLVLAKRCWEKDGCVGADFCLETGIVSMLVELGLGWVADCEELSKFFVTAVAYVGADLRDEAGLVVAFRWGAAIRSRGWRILM